MAHLSRKPVLRSVNPKGLAKCSMQIERITTYPIRCKQSGWLGLVTVGDLLSFGYRAILIDNADCHVTVSSTFGFFVKGLTNGLAAGISGRPG